ncbi:6570_t:CDS:2, partial [Dentiscutata heterogama]
LQANINNMIAQMTRTNTDTNATAPCGSATPVVHIMSLQQPQKSTNQTNILPSNKGKETSQPTGKHTPATVLNDLIMRASKVSFQGQNGTTSSKVHEFSNTQAAKTESVQIWWVRWSKNNRNSSFQAQYFTQTMESSCLWLQKNTNTTQVAPHNPKWNGMTEERYVSTGINNTAQMREFVEEFMPAWCAKKLTTINKNVLKI